MTPPTRFATRFGPAVMLIELEAHLDQRGELHTIDFSSLPFEPQRMFFVRPSGAGEERGGHFHKTAHQLFVCASGRIDVIVDHAGHREIFHLDKPGKAIHLSPLVWSEQIYLSADALLLVLSSERYDPDSYSRTDTVSKT